MYSVSVIYYVKKLGSRFLIEHLRKGVSGSEVTACTVPTRGPSARGWRVDGAALMSAWVRRGVLRLLLLCGRESRGLWPFVCLRCR